MCSKPAGRVTEKASLGAGDSVFSFLIVEPRVLRKGMNVNSSQFSLMVFASSTRFETRRLSSVVSAKDWQWQSKRHIFSLHAELNSGRGRPE